MKKKKLSKQEQLLADHKAYNDQYRNDTRLQMTLAEYTNWLTGSVKLKRNYKSATIAFKPVWAATTDHIPSVISKTKIELRRTSMVEKVKTGEIEGEAANEIISKSKRISIAYSKGSYQYITDGTDLKTIGKKTQGM
jgi:hypothetical protein